MYNVGNVGREERRYEANKTPLYINIGMWVMCIIIDIGLISYAQNQSHRWFLSSSEKALYEALIFLGVVGIIGAFIAMIPAFARMKTFLSVCENGIVGRAGVFGNKQVAILYTDISGVGESPAVITIQTKTGEKLKFSVRDTRLCVNDIRSKMQ